VPIVGDDIKSQVGATITHRVMAKLFEDRGVTLDRTYQLNVGGNMDFKNMLERERLESKKISKTQAVTSNLRVARRQDRGPQRPHRPVGLRRLARRPQVGLCAPRGSRLR
jgi:myo-inositol-1-phosphate synthase